MIIETGFLEGQADLELDTSKDELELLALLPP